LTDPAEESPRKQLGNRLRLLRVRAGLTGDKMPGFTQSKVSRLETGRTTPSLADIEAWARATNAGREEVAELAALVEQLAVATTSWRILHHLGRTEKQEDIAELERDSRAIRVFQPVMVPGLLQIAEYSRRVIEMSLSAPLSDVNLAVHARQERQAILYDQSKRFEFLLTETALRWSPGPPELMRAQLDRLTSVASLPNVQLGLIRLDAGPTAPFLHPFVVFESDQTVITVETFTAELSIRDPADIATYRQYLDQLRAMAVWADAAVREIQTMLPRPQAPDHPR
jgi:transcriptional regulator with XRE-family HTH domain